MNSVRIPLREHIINTADQLFYREGIKSVGVERIISEARIAKATLYNHFSAKEDLVVAYLENRHHRVIAAIERGLPGDRASVSTRVVHVFEMLGRKAESEEFRGCAFVMAVAEHSSAERIVNVAIRHKVAVRDIFRSLLGSDLPQADLVADQLSLLYDGALAQIMIKRSSEPATAAARGAAVLVELALASSQPPLNSIAVERK